MSASFPKASQGGSKRASWLRKLIAACQGNRVLSITGFNRRETVEGIFFDAPVIKPGATGWRFGSVIEVDPTKSYSAQIVINIQATDDLVTTGLIDRTSGILVKAASGLYVSRQSVDAKGDDNKWNVPQNPPPVATNLDDDTNFWIPIAGSAIECPYG